MSPTIATQKSYKSLDISRNPLTSSKKLSLSELGKKSDGYISSTVKFPNCIT
jgi:hypothetical protein